jgi:hypothetical protein
MNTEDDHDIKSFFDDMRKKDRQQSIPEFETMLPKRSTSKLRYIIPVSIAASLIVGFGIWPKTPKIATEQEALVITIENEKITTETLRSDDISVFSWESSTASLINDFND